MKNFKLLDGLRYNKGFIQNPADYIKDTGCNSWLCLTGEEFEKMDEGISYKQVQAATDHSANVISDPPKILDLDLAKQHVSALDTLPRPTLISCRTGPRASAVAYMYSGLKLGADADEVIERAEKDEAPFTKFEDYKDWVRSSIASLRKLDSDVNDTKNE